MRQPDQIPANEKTDGMYKSKLQELCQRRYWPLPEYTTVKEGPLHSPKFKATVVVKGVTFETSDSFRRLKDAQIEAAKVAFTNLTSQPAPERKSPTVTGAGNGRVYSISTYGNKRTMTDETRTSVVEELAQTSVMISNNKRSKHSGELHGCKNQLQSVCVKKGYDLPIYTFECAGPPHNSRFKSKVTVNGQTYESHGFFGTLKESEHAAAKTVLLSFVPHESQDVILDKSVFKNLLQELAQKSKLQIPIYNTVSSGASHMPTFVSTVAVGGETFCGEEAKSKKLAEMNAAEVAYNCLNQREIQGPSGNIPVYESKAASASNLEAFDASDLRAKDVSAKSASASNLEAFDASDLRAKAVSASNLEALDASDLGAANQLGAPSKLISMQSDHGLPISGDQEASKQIPSCTGIGSNRLFGSPTVDITTAISPPHATMEYIPLSKDECPSQTSPKVLHSLVPISTPDIFSEPSSDLSNVVHVYPRVLNMDLPPGAIVQHSDDKWISVRFPENQMGR